jgi:hypothetical protein
MDIAVSLFYSASPHTHEAGLIHVVFVQRIGKPGNVR